MRLPEYDAVFALDEAVGAPGKPCSRKCGRIGEAAVWRKWLCYRCIDEWHAEQDSKDAAVSQRKINRNTRSTHVAAD
jgi:hypothetical protein